MTAIVKDRPRASGANARRGVLQTLSDSLDDFVASRMQHVISEWQFRQAQREIRRFSRLAGGISRR